MCFPPGSNTRPPEGTRPAAAPRQRCGAGSPELQPELAPRRPPPTPTAPRGTCDATRRPRSALSRCPAPAHRPCPRPPPLGRSCGPAPRTHRPGLGSERPRLPPGAGLPGLQASARPLAGGAVAEPRSSGPAPAARSSSRLCPLGTDQQQDGGQPRGRGPGVIVTRTAKSPPPAGEAPINNLCSRSPEIASR